MDKDVCTFKIVETKMTPEELERLIISIVQGSSSHTNENLVLELEGEMLELIDYRFNRGVIKAVFFARERGVFKNYFYDKNTPRPKLKAYETSCKLPPGCLDFSDWLELF